MSFDFKPLDRISTTPLNTQLYRHFKNAIQSGQMKPGEQCPTEQELMNKLNISRSVVNKTYTLLMEQNIIARHRGKGSFVVEKIIDLDFVQRIQPMAELIEKKGLKAEIRLLSRRIIPFDFDTMGNLELNQDDLVFEVSRLYLADDEPLAYFLFYYPLKYFKNIDQYDFQSQMLTQGLHNQYPEQFGSNYRSIFAVNFSDTVSDILKTKKQSAGFKIQILSYDTHKNPSTSTSYYIKGESTVINFDFL